MWLVPSLSVVLLLHAPNCDAFTSDVSSIAKPSVAHIQESFVNDISKSETSSNSSKLFTNKTGHIGQFENEMVPNFLPSNFHDFISSDEELNYGYERSPRELNLSSKQNFYKLFLPRNYHAPKDKLPIGFSSTSQKPPGAHFMSKQYPKLQDRLPPLQLLGLKNADGRAKTEPMTLQNPNSRLARFINVKRQGADSNWDWSHQDDSYDDNMTPFEIMSLMVDRMDPPGKDTGNIASMLKSHIPVMVAAGVIPLSMVLFAALPIIIKNYLPIKGSNPQSTATTTTTATGSRQTINNSTEFLAPILEAIGTFTPRSEDSDCTMKAFCELAKQEKGVWSVQEAIRHMASFVDESILNSIGLKPLIKALIDGDCEKLICSQSKNSTNEYYTYDKL